MTTTKTLREIERPSSPNTAFFVPEGVKTVAERDSTTPIFSLPAPELYSLMVKLWSDQERVKLTDFSEHTLRASFVSRTRFFGFKDDVDVEISPVTDITSSLIIYSRSRVGYSDMGTNRKRVEQWLKLLSEHVKGA